MVVMPRDTTAATVASAVSRRAKKHQKMIEELRDAGALETPGTAVSEYDRARTRLAEMHLSDLEYSAMVHYLVGYAPKGINLALDLVAVRRADAIKRAAALLEA